MIKKLTISSENPYGKGLFDSWVLNGVFLLAFAVFTLGAAYSVNVHITALLTLSIITLIYCLTPQFWAHGKRTFTPLSIATALYSVYFFISIFWASSGKLAIKEFPKYVAPGLIVLILSYLFSRSALNIRRAGWFFATICAACGLLSIDAAGPGLLSFLPKATAARLVPPVQAVYGIFESGSRITSILGNPNVFSGIMILGFFISLWLYSTSEKQKSKVYAAGIMSLITVSFILAFSLGGILSAAVSGIIYLVVSPKGKRLQYLVIPLTGILYSLLLGIFIFKFLGLNNLWALLTLLPIPLCFLNHFILKFISQLYEKALHLQNRRVLRIIAISLCAFFVLLILLAMNLTGSATVNGSIRRGFYPTPGTYSIAVEASGGSYTVGVETQNMPQIMMHTSTVLLNTTVSSGNGTISFDVPENTRVAYLTITGENVKVNSIQLTGGSGTKRIPAAYRLLPSFITNRMQGLWANQNAIQRFVFFKDGVKLGLQNPVFGGGPGYFETMIMSVQSFYYETAYAHNHYIQSFLDGGIVGFLLFTGIIILAFLYLIRSRKRDGANILNACLFGAMTMIAFHSAIEVNFSDMSFCIAAGVILSLIHADCCLKECAEEAEVKVTPTVALQPGVWGLTCLIIALIIFGNIAAVTTSAVNDGDVFARTKAAMILDPLNRDDYKYMYLSVLPTVTNEIPDEIENTAEKYAHRLATGKSRSIIYLISEYYFDRAMYDKGIEALRRYLMLCRSNQAEWNNGYAVLRAVYQENWMNRNNDLANNVKTVSEGILAVYNDMLLANKDLLQPIILSDEDILLLRRASTMQAGGYQNSGDILKVLNAPKEVFQ